MCFTSTCFKIDLIGVEYLRRPLYLSIRSYTATVWIGLDSCDVSSRIHPDHITSTLGPFPVWCTHTYGVHWIDNGGLPPLLRAAQEGLTVAIRVLLGAPTINVNATATRSRKTALVLAARAGHLEVVELLLGAGADVSMGDRRDWTAMHFAAWKGHLGEREMNHLGTCLIICVTCQQHPSAFVLCRNQNCIIHSEHLRITTCMSMALWLSSFCVRKSVRSLRCAFFYRGLYLAANELFL